jgi:hypothetical protein
MTAKAILPLEPLEDIGLEKQSIEVTHHDMLTTFTPKEQKKLMSAAPPLRPTYAAV